MSSLVRSVRNKFFYESAEVRQDTQRHKRTERSDTREDNATK